MNSEPEDSASISTARPTRSSVGRGVLWSGGGAAATQFVSFASFLFIARALDPATFGLVALAAVFVAFLAVVVEQGFTQAVVQRADLKPDHLDTAFWTNLGISMLVASGLVAAAGQIERWLDAPMLAPVLQVLSISLVLGGLGGVHTAILQRRMHFGSLTACALLGTVPGGLVGIGLAWNGFGVWSLVAQTLLGQLINVAGLWYATGWCPGFRYSFARSRELWSYGLSVFGSSLVNFANSRAPELFIGVLFGKAPLGLFAVAAKVQKSLSHLLILTVTRVSLPTLSRLQGEPEIFRRTYYAGLRLTAAVTFPAFTGVVVLSEDIAGVVFGAQWMDAAPLIGLLALIGLPATFGSMSIAAINSLGYPSHNFRLDLMTVVLTVTGVAITARWGLEAVVWALLVLSYLLSPLRFYLLCRIAGTSFGGLFDALFGAGLSALIMAVVVFAVGHGDLDLSPTSRLLLLPMVGIVTYLAALRVSSPKTFKDGEDIASEMLSRRKRAVGK